MMNRFYFDTEFIDTGAKLELISIGVVDEYDNEFYMESAEAPLELACPWVNENVIPHLFKNKNAIADRKTIADKLTEFVYKNSNHLEGCDFVGYYCSYDWVLLCQLFGKMLDLPERFPYLPIDIAAVIRYKHFPAYSTGHNHHALDDAKDIRKITRDFEADLKW